MDMSYYDIQSANKLSADIVKRLMAKRLTDINGKDCSGATKNMIAAMIHFSHICNNVGNIPCYRTSELQIVLRCDRRTTFNVMNDLIRKGFIETSGDNWTGIKNIHIIGNDFSRYDKNKRYLNTNRTFFNYREKDGYNEFMDLSLYAMRTFLDLLLNYNEQYGYHISYDTLAAQIQVKKRRLVDKYINEIKHVVKDDFYSTVPNLIKRLRYGSISIQKNLSYLKPKQRVGRYQDTYYSYQVSSKLRNNNCEFFTDIGTWQMQASRICAIVYNFLKENLKLVDIERVVDKVLIEHGSVTEAMLYDLYGRLNNLTFG